MTPEAIERQRAIKEQANQLGSRIFNAARSMSGIFLNQETFSLCSKAADGIEGLTIKLHPDQRYLTGEPLPQEKVRINVQIDWQRSELEMLGFFEAALVEELSQSKQS